MNNSHFSSRFFVFMSLFLFGLIGHAQINDSTAACRNASMILKLSEDIDSLSGLCSAIEGDFDNAIGGATLLLKKKVIDESGNLDFKIYLDSLLKESERFSLRLLSIKKTIDKKELELKKAFSSFNGECLIIFRSQKVRVFALDLDNSKIDLLVNNDSKELPSNNFSGVLKFAEKSKLKVEMITNAGMFTPKYLPEGLYLDRFKNYYPIDTGSKVEANFYLKPNGVFYIDKKERAFVMTTAEYLELFGMDKPELSIATQSGPMLLVNNNEKPVIHSAFKEGSINRKIRSGVGVTSNGSKRVVFAISKEPMNFYDFSLFYKDWLGCSSALFLDGAISEMYTSEADKDVLQNGFGPIICVSKK
jgi:uncharacterized protein YigE (DUF2233 family)